MWKEQEFYDIPGQIERAREINRRIIELHRKDIDENYRPIGKKWLIGGGNPNKGGGEEWFYLCQAFWNYDDSYGELTDKIRPYFELLTGFGPFTPFFATLALVRNKRALTPALVADFEEYVLKYMDVNMSDESDFIGVNDNTPAMIAAGLILAGEYFGRPEWVAMGKKRVRTLQALLNRRGFLSEYNSLTYTPLTIYGMAAIVNYAKDEEAVVLALEQEKRIWHRTLALTHLATCQNAGPYARAYLQDKLAMTHHIRCLLYALLGDKCKVNPINTIFAPGYDFPGNYDDGNYYWQIINAFVANMVYHCPKAYVQELFTRQYPYIVRGTAETSSSADSHLIKPLSGFIGSKENVLRDPFEELAQQDECYEYSAGVIDIYSYIDKDFSLGTATRDWHNGVQSDGFTLLYAASEQATCQEQIGTVFANYTLNGSNPLSGDLGRKIAFQHRTSAMVLYHPKSMANPVTEAALKLVFGNNRMLRKVIVGEQPLDICKDGLLHHTQQLEPVFVEAANLYMMFVPLMAQEDRKDAFLELSNQNGNMVVGIYNYRGEPKAYARKGLCLLSNGFVCEVRKTTEYESLEDFAAAMGNFKVTETRRSNIHTRYAVERDCCYHNSGLELSCSYSVLTDGIKYMTINGKCLPQVDFSTETLGG